MGVRIRGIYATALTEALETTIVQASDPIRERFDDAAIDTGPASVAVGSSSDRIGVSVSGDPPAVESVAARIGNLSRDTFRWPAAAPVGAVYRGRVRDTRGGGAVVDLGSTSGYLPFDAAADDVETGDAVRVQVARSVPPWDDRRPRLRSQLAIERPLGRILRGESGVRGPADGEVAGLTDLLEASPPDGWGLRWSDGSEAADMETLGSVLRDLEAGARDLEAALSGSAPDPPAAVHSPRATTWIRLGREGRFALDGHRRRVTTTMPGHHRVKAGGGSASTAVDFAEALGEGSEAGGENGPEEPALDFDAVTSTFGPEVGETVGIEHGKPDGRAIDLGPATVTDIDPGGGVTLERELRSAGTYDGLGTEREAGDVARTSIEEGRWWYPTVYRGADGTAKGTYVNVCTPVECFPDRVTYVDLHVDVVERPDGTVERVDDDELAAAVDDGHVAPDLAGKARSVATAVESGLAESR